jgi:hypothetical protein
VATRAPVNESQSAGARFALWLIPGEPHRTRLADLIGDLGRRCGTPRFAPHITLLGGITGTVVALATKTAVLADTLPPLDVRLTDIDCGTSYFHSLFALAEPEAVLVTMRREAQRVFEIDPGRDHRPHLSLFYGEPEMGTKEQIRQTLGGRLDMTLRLDRVGLYRIEGAPSAWHAVAEFRLR